MSDFFRLVLIDLDCLNRLQNGKPCSFPITVAGSDKSINGADHFVYVRFDDDHSKDYIAYEHPEGRRAVLR